ncbi:DNA mismatch repair endonuclease MutL [Paenibacillus sp. JX-17]|uniref:DNA mismatch repair protein MutL n=1 Tax=Paenibacillus lacisoli TaxID=3064525 RepID=A0ABT9C6R0_9BACL|nr:DNA mismatch repair endonuclease MutL [Paenibacillus sp. JX-17]MDO7904954.1 DNA mismatch repair endonuclease MutL [Paenibacillus sp. JX-17]
MAKVQVLDEHIANQIAAGEVVERPSSVVKELVENAIDAGSTRVDVHVEEGGLMSIRVVDNGEGIHPDDVETAFYRHATSKITHGRDLFQITSLGFRGEALPSIAAVSKVELLTSDAEDGQARRIVIEGGRLQTHEDAAGRRGTDFTVKELFYNTPARLKYMKTIQTELGHISDVMYRMAMSHPEIAFTLRHNGNTLLQTMGNGDLLQVIAAIYGTSAAKSMLQLEAESLDYRIGGFVSLPEWTRSNRNAMSTIINGRFVRNYGLNQAILKAYHTLLPINRYPLVVMQLEMHPSLVDVNVHPAKLEVRFSKEQELYAFVEESVKELLQRQVLIPKVVKQSLGRSDSKSFIQEQFHFDKKAAPSSQPELEKRDSNPPSADSGSMNNVPSSHQAEQFSTGSVPRREWTKPQNPDPRPQQSWDTSVKESAAAASYQTETKEPRERREQNSYVQERGSGAALSRQQLEILASPAPELPAFPQMTVIGQHHGTYLIAQNEDGLYLIDQHAAHERINYEFYYEKFGKPAEISQELLLPITLEFTPSESEKLKERLQWFEQAGVYLEHFGGQTFRVSSYPYWFPKGEEQDIIEEMAEWVLSERAIDLAKLREKASILCSCRASIKANQKLTEHESEVLLDRLAACRQPYTCPHGRPIVVSFSSYDLEKLFKRVM